MTSAFKLKVIHQKDHQVRFDQTWNVIPIAAHNKLWSLYESEPILNTGLNMPPNHVLSSWISVVVGGSQIDDSLAEYINTHWKSAFLKLLVQLRTHGFCVMAIGDRNVPHCINIGSDIVLYFKRSMDGETEYKGVMGSGNSSFLGATNGSGSFNLFSNLGSIDEERRRIERTNYFLFVTQAPTSSSHTESRLQCLTMSYSTVQNVTKAVIANANNVAFPAAAAEQKDSSATSGNLNPSANVDIGAHGQAQASLLARQAMSRQFQQANAMITTSIAQSVSAQQMQMAQFASQQQYEADTDPITGLSQYPGLNFQRAADVRLIHPSPGVSIKTIETSALSPQLFEAAHRKYENSVASVTGVPAGMLTSKKQHETSSVNDTEREMYWNTVNFTRESLYVMAKTAIATAFPSVVQTVVMKQTALLYAQWVKDNKLRLESLQTFRKADQDPTEAVVSMMEDNEMYQRLNGGKPVPPSKRRAMGKLDRRFPMWILSGEIQDDNLSDSDSDSDNEESATKKKHFVHTPWKRKIDISAQLKSAQSDAEREIIKKDADILSAFYQENAIQIERFMLITVTCNGLVDRNMWIQLVQAGMITFTSFADNVLRRYMNMPNSAIPPSPLDFATQRPLKEITEEKEKEASHQQKHDNMMENQKIKLDERKLQLAEAKAEEGNRAPPVSVPKSSAKR